MPELPEVETIRGGLERALKGQKLLSIEVRVPKLFFGQKTDLEGRILTDIGRRAKMLILHFKDKFLVIHLKMTGQLLYIPQGKPKNLLVGGHPDPNYSLELPHKHTHIILHFEKGTLFYNDLRKFGWMKIVDEQGLETLVAKLGPEYDWTEFTFEKFEQKLLRRPKITIKQALLDQNIIAGLGNIYTDEVLFCAKIRPDRLASELNSEEIFTIHKCIPEILKIALKHGGTSMKDFRHIDGGWGSYLKFAKVYGRKKMPCLVCGHDIETKKIGSRTSCFCPSCQV